MAQPVGPAVAQPVRAGVAPPVRAVSIPGKTFLVGEYLAIGGGPSVVATTGPRFRARLAGDAQPFHPESPAGRLWAAQAGVEWRDPHAGAGGLGASTAQYLAAWAFCHGLAQPEWAGFLAQYRRLAWAGKGAPPSGADLIAQFVGGISVFDEAKLQAERFSWPFSNLDFTLLRTGAKLATHEHLSASQPEAWPRGPMREIVQSAVVALRSERENDFCLAVNAYGALLAECGLCSAATLDLILRARERLGARLLAAKGCGAMGADVMLLLHAPSARAAAESWAVEAGLALVGRAADIGEGLALDE